MSRTNSYSFYQLDVDDAVKFRLSQHLDKTARGDETVLMSPITNSISPNLLLDEWDKVFNSSSLFMSNDLQLLEASNRSKFGPRSIALPWVERRSSVLDYFSGEKSSISGLQEKLYTNVTSSFHRLRPLSSDNAIKFIKNDTNSGLPYFTRKGVVKDIYSENLQSLLDLRFREYPCIMFTRTQEQKKTRTVWGYPMSDTLFETEYYRPLLEYQRKLNWRSSLSGPDSINRKLTSIVTQAVSSKQKLLSIDFSAFDSTVKSSLQKASFDYISNLFQPHYSSDLEYIAHRFKTIGLVTPDGILTGDHGVPSGSTFTNEVDSIAQYLITGTINLTTDQFDIQGDDGAYRLHDPDKLKETFDSYGLKVNDDKSFVRSGSLVYLQNLFDIQHIKNNLIGGIYPTYRALNRIIYLERFNDFQKDEILGSDYFSIRTIAILENCKHHPLFKELVKLIFKYDKYKLNFSEKGLSNYVKLIGKSKGSEGVILNQYEDQVSGIYNFDTVKIMRELNLG